MSKPFLKYTPLSPHEQRGAFMLLLLIGIVWLAGEIWQAHQQPLTESKETADSIIKALDRHEKGARKQTPALSLFAFDPNRADSATLTALGIPPWMARNIIKYRAKGGRFRKPEHLRKIYGMTEERYQTLAPYITISPEDRLNEEKRSSGSARRDNSSERRFSDSARRDNSSEGGLGDSEVEKMDSMKQSAYVSKYHDKDLNRGDSTRTRKEDTRVWRDNTRQRRDSSWKRIEKYPPGTRICLNRSDTTELKKIPGIGSALSRRIVRYRQQLGGYRSIDQLEEIDLDALALEPWFTIDSTAITPIPVNQVGVRRLMNHPYINFYQAKAIVEYRKRYGNLKSLKPLRLLEEFTEEEIARITPYLSFEEK